MATVIEHEFLINSPQNLNNLRKTKKFNLGQDSKVWK